VSEDEIRQRLVAILSADASGYSRLMAADDRATVLQLEAARKVFRRRIEAHGGRVIDMAGDSVLAVFQSAIGAISAALGVQRDLEASHDPPSDASRMRFRIGVHLGDVIEADDGTVYGNGVNIAARLQTLAEAGGITVSDAIHQAVRGKVSVGFFDRGEQDVKNIPHRVRALSVRLDGGAAAASTASARASPALTERPTIAVLPFANMSGDPEQDYFADGMVDDIIAALARMELFFVIARNTSFVYKGKAVDIRQVGRELGVRYVLEGTVRKFGNRVRITGQLIDAENGHHLWADRFEGTFEDTFELQDRFTESIVSAIEPNVRRAELQRSRVARTSSLNAYDLLLRAIPAIVTPGSARTHKDEALSWIGRALEVDPHYALAKALGAFICWTLTVDGYGTSDDVRTGLRYADEALSERSGDPLILSCAGAVVGSLGYRVSGVRALGFRYEEAHRAVDLALAMSPSLLMVQVCAGNVKAILGDAHAALAHYQRAIAISPLDPAMSALIASTGLAQLLAGRHDDALSAAQHATGMTPNLVLGHRLTVLALGCLGRLDEARPAAQRLLELVPGFTVTAYQSVSPLKDPALRERFGDIYRAAGVPD
jgi:adenylate cyclase